MEYSEKPKAIIFVRTDFCPMPKYIELIESLDISSILEVKYVYSDPEKFNPEPFPLTEKVEILGLFGMTGLELEIIKRYKSIKWIHAFPAGIEKLIEKEEIKNFKGIFTNGRGAYKIQIAEFVSFGILWFCNNCEFWMRKKEEKEYAKYAVESISLNQKTLGMDFYI